MGTCPYGLHSNKHGNCTCGMRKGSGHTKRVDVRAPRSYGRQAPSRMKSPGCSSASSRRAGAAGGSCLMMSALLSLAAVLLGRVIGRLGRGR